MATRLEKYGSFLSRNAKCGAGEMPVALADAVIKLVAGGSCTRPLLLNVFQTTTD